MKKVLSVLMVCILLLSAVWLTACDEKTPSGNETPNSSENSPTDSEGEGNKQDGENKDNESDPPVDPTPVAVDSLNGMSAKQLFEKFMEEYVAARTYDISMEYRAADTETAGEFVEVKLNEDSIYLHMDSEEMKMEYWVADSVMYVNMDGEKYKINDIYAEDLIAESQIDDMLTGLFETAMTDIYLEKLEDVQLYSFEGEYYFTVTITAEEAVENDLGDTDITETVYFDSFGTVKRVVDELEEGIIIGRLNSYGVPVTITLPADVDEYEEQIEETPDAGENDPELYALYTQIIETLADATVYSMTMSVDESPLMIYTTDGEGEYVGSYVEEDLYEFWSVDGKVYVALNGENAMETSMTDDIAFGISSAAAMQQEFTAMLPVDGDSIAKLQIAEDGESSVLTMEYTVMDGMVDYYTILFDAEMTCVDIIVVSEIDGEVYSTATCFFSEINSATLVVEAPVARV